MVRLLLIRHGQTEWNTAGRYQGQSDVPLSSTGKEQAALLAKNFPFSRLDAIYASDLSRAFVTAEIIGEKFSLCPKKEKAFRELSFGLWEGLTYGEIEKKWPEAIKDFFTAPDRLVIPGGETFFEVAERALARIKEIVALHSGETGDIGAATVAIVAHGAVIRAVIATLMHIPLRYLWSIRQDNTALNVFLFDGDFVNAELLNSTYHLSPMLSFGAIKGQSPK